MIARTLHQYQVDGVEWLKDHPRGLLGDEPGAGKTATALVALAEAGHRRALVVCPLVVARHWAAEARTWTKFSAYVMCGTGAQRRDIGRAWYADPSPAVLITNYEAALKDLEILRQLDVTAVVADEVHRAKNRKSKTYRMLKALCPRGRTTWLVTGTPMMNRPDELWSLLNILAPGDWPSYWRFAHGFCQVGELWVYGRKITQVGDPRPEMLPVLRQQLRPHMLRRQIHEILPELGEEPIPVSLEIDLSDAERSAYRKMAKQFFTQVEATTTIAPNEVSKITRLRQLAVDWETLGATTTSSKLKALYDLLDDLVPSQVVVFSSFRKVAERIAQHTGAGQITGAVSQKERGEVLAAFRAETLRILVGTIRAIGEGMDGMQVARHCVFVDRDWNPARNEQAVARLRRRGQQGLVVVYHLVTKGTIDHTVARANAHKVAVTQEVVGSTPQVVLFPDD